ncbi:uncharacterized protein LOC135841300 [Planococcus citri]|uniref:uncharacterized protein LOC135841300 n=1 Tax=Planococcus citri TaxID=170843 RepID=UPI0031F9E226
MEVLKTDPASIRPLSDKTFDTEIGTDVIPNLPSSPYVKKPTESNIDDAFSNVIAGLADKSWETRNQTLIELRKLIPETKIDLKSKITKEVLRLVTLNLSNVVPYVHQNALDVILAFVAYSSDAENVLRNVITFGVDTSTADANLSLNTIHDMPIILRSLQQRTSSKNVSHQLLVQLVTSLSKRMVQITHQKHVVVSLLRIKGLIGASMFDHFLETYYPQVKRDFDVLCNVYDTDIFSEISDHDRQPDQTALEYEEDCEGNSDDDVIMKVYDEDGNEIKRTSSRRVTFGGEIVKIRTPDSDATAINCSVKDKLDISANILIQLSSDESLDSGNESINVSTTNETIKCDKSRPRSSHIPLPIRPALHKPKPPLTAFRQPSISLLNGSAKQKTDYEILNEIPNYEGESLTSSSDSSDRGRTVFVTNASLSMSDEQKYTTLKNNTLSELHKLKINDRIVLENLFNKDDWRFFVSGLERLTQILSQTQINQALTSPNAETTGVSLLCYIFNGLTETNNSRVITSSLRALRVLCQVIDASILALNLAAIVPIFCSYLSCEYDTAIQLEAVETLKMLMRKFSPQTVVDFLFTDQSFFSKSSKMRENSLLCLMYALLAFPSTEFNVNELAETLIKQGINEPKRRVRQALLDALSILGQFIPRSQFRIDNADEETLAFKKALRARLTRRQLPSISSSGLLLYAFQISSKTAFGTDIEWILAGRGSLSDNYNKSKAKFNYAHGDDISPIQTQQSWNLDSDKVHSAKECGQPSEYSSYYSQNIINRGNSEETLYTNSRLYDFDRNNSFERYSADWTDARFSSNFFENLHHRYPSTLSDTSSYASSCASDQNFPRLDPAYESNLVSIGRPVSEDKLDRLSNYKKSTKLPVRLEPTIRSVPIHYSYNTGGSLPILNDKKEKTTYFHSFYQNRQEPDTQLSSDSDSKSRWSKNRENNYKQSKSHNESNGNANQIKTKHNGQPLENNNILNSAGSKHQNIDRTKFRRRKPKQPEKSNKNEEKPGKKIETNAQQTTTNEEEKEDPEDKLTDLLSEDQNKNISEESKPKNGSTNDTSNEKSKKYLERKVGVKLKRSLTKEIKMPQSTFNINPEQLPPFENPKEAINKILDQFQSNEWETVIEALQGVVRLTRHHNKYLAPCLHTFVIAVAKEIRNLRSQVARAACLSAENIFRCFDKISNQDIEELSQVLFLRTADTNKFLREDSNRALDAMVENIKFSKCAVILTQKISSHPNALVRATTARLMCKMVELYGPAKILSLSKERKEAILTTAVRFLMDGNLQTRNHGKNILLMLNEDKRTFEILTEIVPTNVMSTVNKFLRNVKK